MAEPRVNTPDLAKRRREKNRKEKNRPRPRFGSIEDAAEYLGISRAHFYLHILPKVKTAHIGRRHLIELDSLDQVGDELSAAK